MAPDADRIDRAAIAAVCDRHGLALLVLFGSRARSAGRPESDTDLAFRARNPAAHVDRHAIFRDLADALGTGRIDLVDLGTAPPVLAYEATIRGVPLFEDRTGRFAEERLAAIQRRMDTEPLRLQQRRFVDGWLAGHVA